MMVRVFIQAPIGPGKRRGWTRRVTAVDTSKDDGYAFDGPFLRWDRKMDLPIGAYIVGRVPTGSADDGVNKWRFGQVTADGMEWEATLWPPGDFLDFRDHVARAVQPQIELDALLDERHTLLQRLAVIEARVVELHT